MQEDKMDEIMSHLTTLRNKKVALDYDLSTIVGLTMDEVEAIMEAEGEKFRNYDAMKITAAEREVLLQDERFATLEEKPRLRWAFTITGITLLIMQLHDKASVGFTHYIIETYIDVVCLRNVMQLLSELGDKESEDREKLMRDCNLLMNKVLAGDDPDYSFNVRAASTLRGHRPADSCIPPFTHPENRYDPTTKRFWFSEEEVSILQDALGDSMPEFSEIKREEVN